MDFSARLNLPFLLPNQAQKHVTCNEVFRNLDSLVQLAVISTGIAVEPEMPTEGDAYILPAGASGSNWSAAAANSIAVFADLTWRFLEPQPGWCAYDLSRSALIVFETGEWHLVEPPPPVTAPQLGINTDASGVNRLAVKSDAVLMSHDDLTPGTGDMRVVLNKAGPGLTGTVLFQSDYEGRAEIGLAGDDNLHLRVSDGTSWADGMVIGSTTGTASFPAGLVHHASGARQSGIILTPGGDGEVSVFRTDVARSPAPRTYVLAGVTGDTLTLTSPSASEIFLNAYMEGVSLLRVWNTSRTPAEPAWVRRSDGTNGLQVTDSADIAAWLTDDTLQVGDPASVTPGSCMALDISPMMSARLGAVFPQTGLLLKIGAAGAAGSEVSLDASPSGAVGSFAGVKSTDTGALRISQLVVPTDQSSPVSDSNLVFVREGGASGGLGVCLVSVTGVLA